MDEKELEVEEGQEVVRRTIVGGRPLARRYRKLKVPIGIEKVLCRAAADPRFRTLLLEHRATTVDAIRDSLSPQEKAILSSVPDRILSTLVANINVSTHGAGRFMKRVLATALAASTAAVLGCDDKGTVDVHHPMDCGGCVPEDTKELRVPDAGAMPDLPDIIETDYRNFELGDLADNPLDANSADTLADAPADADNLDVADLPAPGGILPDVIE